MQVDIREAKNRLSELVESTHARRSANSTEATACEEQAKHGIYLLRTFWPYRRRVLAPFLN